jgi:hypothetical protein
MRKLVIVLLLIFLTFFSFGQITFNNIKLGGPYYNFKLELQKKGFIYHSNNEKEAANIFSYSGEFIDKDVDIEVLVTPTTKMVWKVNIELPESNSWASIKSDFFDLAKKMNQKYGTPISIDEYFSKPYYDGDGNELLAFYQDKCTYVHKWKTENGFIGIKIISSGQGTARINISYEDKNAGAVNSAEKDKIIMDGL